MNFRIKSPKRKSPKRKSRSRLPKRKSPKRKSRSVRRKSHNMLKGGTKDDSTCDKCFQKLDDKDGIIKTKKTGHKDKATKTWVDETIQEWIHNETHKDKCSAAQKAHYVVTKEEFLKKKELDEKAEKDAKAAKEVMEQKIANEVFLKNYQDKQREKFAKQLVSDEMEDERLRFDALTEEQQKDEEDGDFFKFPKKPSQEENEIMKKEKIYRGKYKFKQQVNKGGMFKVVQDVYSPADRIVIVYSVNSINKINSNWQIPNTYSIEIHCTTFRPPNNPNDPSQNFYGHVTLNIHRGISQTGGINSEKYHYGVHPEKSGKVLDFIRKFWNDKYDIIQKPTVSLLDINDENQHLAFLFPQKTAGDLMIEYYNWCIRNCPRRKEAEKGNSYKVLTRWGSI